VNAHSSIATQILGQTKLNKKLTYNQNIIQNTNFIVNCKKTQTILLSAVQARLFQRAGDENSSTRPLPSIVAE
jgi:hypothetical protein